MGGEPGDHRDTEPVDVIGQPVQVGTADAGVDQDQPVVATHHGGVAPDPLALPDPDAVRHLTQHRFTVSGAFLRRESPPVQTVARNRRRWR
jgi:hypothetical protein